MRLNDDIINNRLNEYGLSLYNDTFHGKIEKHYLVDIYGYFYYSKIDQIMYRGVLPKKFDMSNPFTLKNLQTYITSHGSKTEVITSEYNGCRTNISLKCGMCGCEYECIMSNILFYDKFICNDCTIKKSSSIVMDESNDIDKSPSAATEGDVCRYLHKKGYRLLEQFSNVKDKHTIEDSAGYKYYAKPIEIIYRNHTPFKFSVRNPYTIDNLQKLIYSYGSNTKIISDEFHGNGKNLKFICGLCGLQYETVAGKLINYGKVCCNTCSRSNMLKRSESTYEKKTEDYLILNGITYAKQYCFDDCRSDKNRMLRYDFAIFLNNKEDVSFLIEVDGEQHFSYTPYFHDRGTNTCSFEDQIYRDDVKTSYCEKNDLYLLRIPYTEYKNNNYINILDNTIQYIQNGVA